MFNNVFAPVLFKENFKRCRAMMAVAFLIGFLGAPLRFIRYLNDSNFINRTPSDAFLTFNFETAFVASILPVCLAMMVFSYLHKNAYCSSMHAMPYTRKSLYITNCASIVLFSMLPIFINGIIMLAFLPADCTFLMLAEWFVFHFIVVCFVAATAAIAAMLTGNGILQFLTTGGLNFVLPAFLLISAVYCDRYIYGWVSDDVFQYMEYLNPFFFCAEGGVGFFNRESPILLAVIYVLVSGILFAGGYHLYKIRKLERWGESYVFEPARRIILVLLVVCSSTVIGLLLEDAFELEDFIGYIFGGIASFIVAMMITKKTTRVFNRESIRPAMVCAACIALIAGGFKYDALGLAKMVPNNSKIDSVCINGVSGFNSYSADSGISFDEAENIRLASEFNSQIVSRGKYFKDQKLEDGTSAGYEVEWRYIDVNYKLKNGKTIYRSYYVPLTFLEQSTELRALFESNEGRQIYETLREINPEMMQYFNLYLYDNEGRELPELMKELYARAEIIGYDFDLLSLSYQDQRALMNALADDGKLIGYEEMLEDTAWNYYTGVMDYEYYDSNKNCNWGSFRLSENTPKTIELLLKYIDEGKLKAISYEY